MPVEIRELVIKATITQDNNSGTSQAGGTSPNAPNIELVKACVEKVLELIKDKHAR